MSSRKQVRGGAVEQLLRSSLSGLDQAVPQETLVVNGVLLTKTDLKNRLASLIAPYDAATAAQAAASEAVKQREAAEPDAAVFARAFVTAVEAQVGTDPKTLGGLGIAPPKVRRQLTVEEKTAAAAKARATRKLRNTLGSRQKASLKAQGPVTVSVSGPDTTGSSKANTVVPTSVVDPATSPTATPAK